MLRIRLSAPELEFWVEVTLHNREERWLAIAMIGGEPHIGTGASVLDATYSALAELGSEAKLSAAAGLATPDLPTA